MEKWRALPWKQKLYEKQHLFHWAIYSSAIFLGKYSFWFEINKVAICLHIVTRELFHHDFSALQWRHNGHDGISNHQAHGCLLNRLFRHRSKKTTKLCVTGLCEGNSPITGEFPVQRASNVGNVSIWWCHHGTHVSLPMAILPFQYLWFFFFFNWKAHNKLNNFN